MNVDGLTLVILLSLVAAFVALLVVMDRAWGAPEPLNDAGPVARVTRLVDVFVTAAWFGLATGLIHLSLAFVNRYVRGHFLMVSPQIVWLAPAAYVAIFVALALLPAAVVLARPRFLASRPSIAGFAWLGVFALLLPFRQLHWAAAAAVAAGVASQVSRVMARRPARWRRLMRTTGLTASVAIMGMALGLAGWRSVAETLALHWLPDARQGAPNVLLIVMDTVRAANLSLQGYGRPTTPQLERRAQEGTTFDRAFSTGPWTLKSHATMFTGLYPGQMIGDFERPVATEAPMLAEVFRDQGYVTGGFVANLAYTSRESGLARGFSHYDDYRVTPRQLVMHSWLAHTPLFREIVNSRSPVALVRAMTHARLDFEPDDFNDRTYARRPAGDINVAFLDWQSAHADRPFFAFLNYFDAHVVYRSPPDFAARFALPDQPSVGHYDGAIAYIDHEIGRLLDELARRGVLDNTIVVITSDHGELFGEHGLSLHANSLYLPLLHVPLMIRYPARVPKGTRVDTLVTLRDLASTVIDLAGLSPKVTMPGRSLVASPGTAPSGSVVAAELEQAIRPSPDWPVFHGPMQTVFDARFHYIRRGDGQEELYDYRADPAETSNLAQTPAGQAELPRLRSLLSAKAER